MQRSLLQILTSGNEEQKGGKNWIVGNSDVVVLNGSCYFPDLQFLHKLKYLSTYSSLHLETFFITKFMSRQNILSQTPPEHSIFNYAFKILSHLTFDKLCHTCCASVTLHWKSSNKPVRIFTQSLKICANSEVNQGLECTIRETNFPFWASPGETLQYFHD